MSKHLKRVLALLLVLVMVLGLLPTIAFAAETDSGSERALGRRNPEKYEQQVEEAQANPPKQSTPKTALPASYNSNTLGYITPVRNQGNYGTCWAHGAIASCEAYMIKHGVKVGTGSAATTSLNLSESHLAWFGYSDAYDALGLLAGDKTKAASDYRDLGGFGEIPTYTLMRWEGLASESTSGLAYSSMPKNGLSSSYAYQYNVAHVQDCVWIPTSDRTAVKEAIMEYGAGTFGYYADDGEHEKSDGSYYYPTNESSNHDVTVVGWDDNYSKSKFTSPQPAGNGAWIIKNSWGTSYGTNGYYYISYYDVPSNNDTCYFYKVEPVDNYDNNYQYDGTTNFNNYMQLKRNGSVANVFTANGTETLEAVAFCNWTAGMSYKCDIYKNPTNASNPTTGTLVSTKTGTFEFAGYHTVELDTTVSLSAGDKFAVVFTNTGNNTIEIGLDQSGSSTGWVSWTHASPSKASCYTSNGTWTDYSNTANFRIKAYTKNGQVTQDPCTITLKAGTNTWRTVDTTTNTSATLPNYTGTVPTGYTFAGWTASQISGTTQSAPTLYNGSYATGDATAITLYACFSKSESSGGSSTGYRLMTSAPVAGDQIIIAGKNGSSYYAFKTDASTAGVAITVSNNLVTSDPTNLVWEVESGSYGNTSGLTLSTSGYYLHINSSALKVVNNDKNNGIFGFTSTGNNTYSVDGLVNSKYLGFSGTSFSASGSATGLYLFKYGTGSGSTTTYTTTMTVCSHTYSETDRLDATCTDEGTIEYTCSKCGDTYYEDLPALGHQLSYTYYDEDMHEVVCTRSGCTYNDLEECTYVNGTCSKCGHVKVLATYTVTYNVLGTTSTASCTEGQSVTLPTTATAVEGYTFAGWVKNAINNETATAPTVLTGSYKPTASTTLYALYTRTEAGTGTGSSNEFTKVTSAPSDWSGDYLIVWEDGEGGATVFNGESGTEKYATGTISNNKITKADDYAVVTIEKMTGGYSLYVDGKGYMKGTSGNNALSYATSAQLNTIEMDDDGVLITSNSSVLRWNNATSNGHMFRYYKSSTYSAQQPIQLYKKGAGSSSTTYYTTAPVYVAPCEHTNTHVVNAAAATCTAAGYTGDTICDDCGTTVSTGTAIAALGHSYGAFSHVANSNPSKHSKTCSRCSDKVTENCSYTTSTSGATTTFTCSVCNYSYNTTLDTYTVSYNVLGSVVNTASCIEGQSVTLPATATAVEGYTFAGWVKNAIGTETTTAPTVLTGSYKPTADVTMYALYTRIEEGTGSGATGYYLATETPAVGDLIIIAIKDGSNWYALPNGKNSGSASIGGEELTVTNGRAADTEDITFEVVDHEGDTGIMSTYCDPAAYLALNSSKLALNGWGPTKAIAFEAGTEAGTYYIIGVKSGSTGNEGRALDFSGSSFTVDPEDGGSPVYIFVSSEGGSGDTTYYTTVPVVKTPCTHENTTLTGAVAATCETAGYTGDRVCDDCGITVTTGTAIAALGHDLVAGAIITPTCTTSGYTEYNCSRCDYSENKDEIDPLGHNLSWDGVVGNGISHNLACARCDYTEAEACTIVNGSCSVCGYVAKTAEIGDYARVTAALDDWSGTYLIVYEGSSYAFNGSLSTPNSSGNYNTVSIVDGVVVGDDTVDAYAVTIEKVEGTDYYTIKLGSGKYMGNTGTSTGINASTTKYQNAISLDAEGNAIIANTSGTNTYNIRFNSGSSSNRFAFYGTSTGYAVKLYKRVECDHNWGTGVITTPATCTAEGVMTYTCSICSESKTEAIPMAAHTPAAYPEAAASCTEPGSTGGTYCSVCKAELTAATVIPALGHDLAWDGNVGDGNHTLACSRCDYTETEACNIVDGVCTVCGYTEEPAGPVVDPALKFYSIGMSLQDSLTFNFLVQNKVLKNYDSYYVSFTCNDWSTATPVTSNVDGVLYYTNYQRFDYFVFGMQMTDDITAVIHAFKDGVEYVSEPTVTSVESYALGKLPSQTDAYKAVLANLLEYGAKSQTYFNYGTDRLANRSLGEYAAYVTEGAPTVVNQTATTGTAGSVVLYSSALGVEEAIKPQFAIRLPSGQNTPSNFYVIATYSDKEVRIDSDEWISMGSRIYALYVEGLTAQMGKTPVSITVYSAATNAPVSATFTYSIQSHVYKAQNNAATPAAQMDALNAMMNYYNAVEAAYGPA